MTESSSAEKGMLAEPPRNRWRSFFGRDSAGSDSGSGDSGKGEQPARWSMGVLNDTRTHEVPGSVLLLTGERNEPLGLRNAPARTSSSSLPSSYPTLTSRKNSAAGSLENKKKTKDGAIILEPQPDDSHNDPLNWPSWRRDTALFSLGFYCMVGGGMTPILAAGFTNVASTYEVTVSQVALTTGLYMMGLGVGSVVASPTAILYGKRPVYLVSAVLFIATSVWCAASPTYISLLIARIIQGMSVSPVECLPSATIAEIFFLHERAYRIGIYTLLLLGGKNLIPLVSAAIIQSLDWRWVFWVVTIVVGFCWVVLFLFVPETFWDRTPRPRHHKHSHHTSTSSLSKLKKLSLVHTQPSSRSEEASGAIGDLRQTVTSMPAPGMPSSVSNSVRRPSRLLHVEFAAEDAGFKEDAAQKSETTNDHLEVPAIAPTAPMKMEDVLDFNFQATQPLFSRPVRHPPDVVPPTPGLKNCNSPSYEKMERAQTSFPWLGAYPSQNKAEEVPAPRIERCASTPARPPGPERYTTFLKDQPRRSFTQQLKPWNGRLHHDNWFRVAVRPFVLYAYPAVLWSAIVYSCSVGWLIVLSESVAEIYRSESTYNFSALSTGLIYLSPFIGGILGTAVAGKVSDIIVRTMSRRNGGLYEPEFRLVMAVPITLTTVIGLMGFGWSAAERDAWIVPTVFFGVISFGCSLGSTTAITFCVDSYRAYAGEALVTLNFSKNIFHGLVFSLFFNRWLSAEGSKKVFVALGGIQLALMLLSVPMYVFGKRARMWTVRRNFMEKF